MNLSLNKTFALSRTLALTLAISLSFLSACSQKSPENATSPAKAAAHEELERLTYFTDSAELYLELPPLVAGQATTLTAYLTDLAQHQAIANAKVDVILSNSTDQQQVSVDTPITAGIFKPIITPKMAGDYELKIAVETAQAKLMYDLGSFKVYADHKALAAAEAEHGEHDHGEEGILFTKEQQWKVNFATAEAQQGLARTSIRANATLRAPPGKEAILLAPSAGLLNATAHFPQIGQSVQQGQTLVMFRPRLGGENDQASLDAAARKAQLSFELAQRDRVRMEELFKEEAVAEKRLIEARSNERMASAELQAAQARAQQISGLGGIAIKSPISGIIADISAAPGSFLNEAAPLLHIADTSRLWLEVRIPESEIGRLGTPSGAAFSVTGYPQSFEIDLQRNGKLIALGTVVDAQTRTVPVIFEFLNPERSLRLGLTATAQVFSKLATDQNVLRIPYSAVQDENGQTVVYLQISGERFERRLVKLGPRDGENVAILSGLKEGQRVVSQGAYLIRLSTAKASSDGHAGHSH